MTELNPESTTSPLKPGYQTTEGAAALVGVVGPLLAVLLGSETLKAKPWALVALIGILAAVAIAYIFARTWLKRGAAAIALVLLLGAPARAQGRDDVMRPAFVPGPAAASVVQPGADGAVPAVAVDPRLPLCPPAAAVAEPAWLTALRITLESALATAATAIAAVQIARGAP